MTCSHGTPLSRSASSGTVISDSTSALDLPYEQFCFACFDGRYPEPVPYDAGERKFMLEMAGTR